MLSAVFVALISKRRRLTAVYVSFFVTFAVHILLVPFLSFREGTLKASTEGTFDTKNSIRIRNVRRELFVSSNRCCFGDARRTHVEDYKYVQNLNEKTLWRENIYET